MAFPATAAAAAAALWLRNHDPDVEREHLLRIIVDGELLLLDDGTIPADGYEPQLVGPEWMQRVVGYKIGRSSTARSEGLFYLGDRRDGDARAVPWIGPALPFAAALLNIRISAGHGLGALAKIAAIIANVSPDRITASSAARTGLVTGDDRNENQAGPRTTHVRWCRERTAHASRGGRAAHRRWDLTRRRWPTRASSKSDAAAALNVPVDRAHLRLQQSGSFSNLRMSLAATLNESTRAGGQWWHRNYRLPMWREMLTMGFADGALPRMSRDTLAALRMPSWPGPKREPPQPEKEIAGLKMLVDAGILTAAQAASKLET